MLLERSRQRHETGEIESRSSEEKANIQRSRRLACMDSIAIAKDIQYTVGIGSSLHGAGRPRHRAYHCESRMLSVYTKLYQELALWHPSCGADLLLTPHGRSSF